MIARDIYLNQLIERKESSKIKNVIGLRRSGKSYLSNTLFRNHLLNNGIEKSQIISVEFDNEKMRG